nr:hypothetical protein [Acidobacteriota bacterium]
FLKRILKNRLGHLLLVFHLCLTVYYFAQLNVEYGRGTEHLTVSRQDLSGRFIAGRFIDFDSGLFKILFFLDLIPLHIHMLITKAVIYLFPYLGVQTVSWVQASLLLVLTSIQWLLVGYFIGKMIKLWRASE